MTRYDERESLGADSRKEGTDTESTGGTFSGVAETVVRFFEKTSNYKLFAIITLIGYIVIASSGNIKCNCDVYRYIFFIVVVLVISVIIRFFDKKKRTSTK